MNRDEKVVVQQPRLFSHISVTRSQMKQQIFMSFSCVFNMNGVFLLRRRPPNSRTWPWCRLTGIPPRELVSALSLPGVSGADGDAALEEPALRGTGPTSCSPDTRGSWTRTTPQWDSWRHRTKQETARNQTWGHINKWYRHTVSFYSQCLGCDFLDWALL